MIEKEASECAAEHDGELDGSDHEAAAAFGLVTDALCEPVGPADGMAELMAPHVIMAERLPICGIARREELR